MAGGRFELAMEPTTIRLVSLNSNSEMHMTAICDARLIFGKGWISWVFICCAALSIVTHTNTHQHKNKGASRILERGVKGSRKGWSVGIFKLTSRQKPAN